MDDSWVSDRCCCGGCRVSSLGKERKRWMRPWGKGEKESDEGKGCGLAIIEWDGGWPGLRRGRL